MKNKTLAAAYRNLWIPDGFNMFGNPKCKHPTQQDLNRMIRQIAELEAQLKQTNIVLDDYIEADRAVERI